MGGIATLGGSHGCYLKKAPHGSNGLTRASTHVCTQPTCARGYTLASMHTHAHLFSYIIHTHPFPYAHMDTPANSHILWAHAPTCAQVCTHAHLHTYTPVPHTLTHTCTHVHAHACTCPPTRTFTETHLCTHIFILYEHTHVYKRGCSVHTHPTLRHIHARFREPAEAAHSQLLAGRVRL